MNKFRTPTSKGFALKIKEKMLYAEPEWFMNFPPTPTSSSYGISFTEIRVKNAETH